MLFNLPHLYLNREFEMDFLLALIPVFPRNYFENNYDLILLFIINDFPYYLDGHCCYYSF